MFWKAVYDSAEFAKFDEQGIVLEVSMGCSEGIHICVDQNAFTAFVCVIRFIMDRAI